MSQQMLTHFEKMETIEADFFNTRHDLYKFLTKLLHQIQLFNASEHITESTKLASSSGLS